MNDNEKGVVWASWKEKANHSEQAKILSERIVRRPSLEFYDLEKDPYELNNLATNPAYADKVKEYDTKLKKWMEEEHDPGASVDRIYQ